MMKQFWQIVPIGNGYTYLGLQDGEHIECSKMKNRVNTSLLFKSKLDCVQYITKNLSVDKYDAEEVYLDEKYYGLK